MTTQQHPTAADFAPGPGSPRQGSHLWLLTLELPGRVMNTSRGTLTPPFGWTRYDVLLGLLEQIVAEQPELATAAVTAFVLEPNVL
ncbi:hypothetical protein [Streptomyces genisteinicus]|uniref:Uncharacterized protein n=1 Tax=Streptomyces genisteinicus TaxID=2768068 RepID=A0A7H0I598_9ACTN|nr:hypothetical protein [Streptomyces genisteinicus]QNP67964.1 hypothetical protein IAG43_33915 [Streptomyces genisteinicus]